MKPACGCGLHSDLRAVDRWYVVAGMRGLPLLACEAAACVAFSACGRHLTRLRSAVRSRLTCDRRLMRLSPRHDRLGRQQRVRRHLYPMRTHY
ncbi:hypothetical protein GW17_00036877 [Ensete ventricosum]|nr:hypothetical protein GW17_00036877 [Ensete ventricosum]